MEGVVSFLVSFGILRGYFVVIKFSIGVCGRWVSLGMLG